jgi:hypothetical protein
MNQVDAASRRVGSSGMMPLLRMSAAISFLSNALKIDTNAFQASPRASWVSSSIISEFPRNRSEKNCFANASTMGRMFISKWACGPADSAIEPMGKG